jgi:carboxyl-terminal processing protease
MSHLKIKTFILLSILALPFISCAKQPTPAPLEPGPNDGNIAYITARLLEEFHYTQHPFDTEMSEKFYDSYLDAYDPQHVYFLQSDIDEFSHYRTNLDLLTFGSHGQADVSPAYKIYARFMERLQQRITYVEQLLQRDNFNFNTDEQAPINRKNAPWPKDLDEAKKIWREQLLYQFLQEKMNRETSPNTVLAATNVADITQTIKHQYDRELLVFQEWYNSDVLQAYLDSLTHAYDPHSDYFNNEHAQDFSISMSLSLGGIGAELTWDDGYCEIQSLVPGGPAEKSGQLKPDDKIIAVAQGKSPPVDVVNMELSRIVQLIRGQKGTEVRLTIIPANEPNSRRVVKLIRAEINLKDEEAKAELIESSDSHGGTNRIGVIDVPSFYAPVPLGGNAPEATNYVSADVAALIQKLVHEKVGGIILDLRNNPGGSLEEAIQFVGLFVTNGPMVQIRAPENDIRVERNDEALDIYHGPLVVLANRLSASASEIVAAALQDYGRALIVGDTSTFGKGTVQNLTQLAPLVWPASESATNDPGTVKITIRKFYRINGASTQLKGVIPDIVLPDIWSYRSDIGESALPYALSWDTIAPADYTALNDVQPYLTELSQQSGARVATNQDFVYVQQDIDEVQKVQSQKFDTLNERKAWDEKEKFDRENKARQKEVDSRRIPNETVYEISLEDAAKPGLPAPIKWETYAESTNVVSLNVTNNPESAITTSPSEAMPIKKVWAPDPMLDETERILRDYISLWPLAQTDIARHE